jgi:hypothetical protein
LFWGFFVLLTLFNTGIYGEKELGTTSTTPGSRYNAVSWTDLEGTFWLFGGSGCDNSSFEDSIYLFLDALLPLQLVTLTTKQEPSMTCGDLTLNPSLGLGCMALAYLKHMVSGKCGVFQAFTSSLRSLWNHWRRHK